MISKPMLRSVYYHLNCMHLLFHEMTFELVGTTYEIKTLYNWYLKSQTVGSQLTKKHIPCLWLIPTNNLNPVIIGRLFCFVFILFFLQALLMNIDLPNPRSALLINNKNKAKRPKLIGQT